MMKNKITHREFRYKCLAFSITFITVATLHIARTSWSYIKSSIKNDLIENITSSYLGSVDLIFLIFYGAG